MSDSREQFLKISVALSFVVASFVLFVSFYSLSDDGPNYAMISKINENLYKNVQNINLRNKTVAISSVGGNNYWAIKLAQKIEAEKISLNVHYDCTSACAEFLLPAANQVKFIDNPMIGFHWSPLMNMDQFLRFGGTQSGCESQREAYKYQKYIFKKNELNPKFWMEVEKRLQLITYDGTVDNCSTGKRKFLNKLWLPTSNQLKNLLRLNFEGGVCADDFKECRNKVNLLWPEGTRIVIGDKLHIVEKPSFSCSEALEICSILITAHMKEGTIVIDSQNTYRLQKSVNQ